MASPPLPDPGTDWLTPLQRGFLERFFGYGHVTRTIKDKPFIGVVTPDWFQEMVVEKWWDGKRKLVPLDWIRENKEND